MVRATFFKSTLPPPVRCIAMDDGRRILVRRVPRLGPVAEIYDTDGMIMDAVSLHSLRLAVEHEPDRLASIFIALQDDDILDSNGMILNFVERPKPRPVAYMYA